MTDVVNEQSTVSENPDIQVVESQAPAASVVVEARSQIDVVELEATELVFIETPDVDTVYVADTEPVHVVEVGAVGQKGDQGPVGPAGSPLPSGTNTGDFIRYNPATDAWEVSSEPLVLKGLVLTPAASSLVTAEGALYYSSLDKAIKVCTDAI